MIEKLRDLLTPLIKCSHKVKAFPKELESGDLLKIRFGGHPYSETGSKAPVCKKCGRPLTFIFQFFTKPESSSGEFLQFFYCFDCSPTGDRNEEGQWLVRGFSDPQDSKHTQNLTPIEDQVTPCICRLEAVKMLPDFESLEEMNHEAIKVCEKIDREDPWDVYEEGCIALGCESEPFSSIGGYPIWIQGPVSKNCPICKKEMEFIAQIDSVPEAGLMWGDAGCVYIFRCSKHSESFAIEMQCF